MEAHDATQQTGERVVRCVRDYTIQQYFDLLAGRIRAPADQELQRRITALPAECRQVLHEIGPRLVDETLHNFLWMLEGGEGLELLLKEPSGEKVSVTRLSDGLSVDMHDWIDRFSKYPPSLKP